MRSIRKNLLVGALALGATGCVTAPIAPNASIDPRGEWTVVAVNGEATGGGRFYFDIHPPSGNARFGCNAAGGSLEVSSGYVTTGQWIITTASCTPRDLAHFERDGFAITALPMAVDRTAAGGIRLRNRLGSLDLIRAPDLAQQIIGEWMVSRIDGRPIQADERFALTVTPAFVRTTGVCNDVQGSYLIVGRRMMPNGPPWPRAQRGCKRERMTLEDRVHAAFWDGPDIAMPTPDQLRVTSTRGSIDFERKR